jgi:4-diphosphocytidyl-2-C-methyl-D-erythritol kinase
MIVLRELAPAKVNLYLHVTGRRQDGYHLLDSLTVFADIADKLEVVPSGRLTVAFEGPYATSLLADDNSVLKAAERLRAYAKAGAGAAITLHKYLPVAGGIGGGSADAAATLRLLLRFWNIRVPQQDLEAMALALGADVPACLRSSSLYMEGIGERIEQGPRLAGLHAVLANPGRQLKTQEVFAAYKPPFSTPPRHPASFATPSACAEFLHKARNDLEPPAVALMPEIAVVKDALKGQKDCLLARMSGSGATCFGLFASAASAQDAAGKLRAEHPAWWVEATGLR